MNLTQSLPLQENMWGKGRVYKMYSYDVIDKTLFYYGFPASLRAVAYDNFYAIISIKLSLL